MREPTGLREVASVSCPGRKSVRSLAADGTRVVACASTVRLFDARTFAPAGQLPEAAAAAAFLGDTLAVAGKDEEGAYLRLYDLRKATGAKAEPLRKLDVGKAEPAVLGRVESGLLVGSHDKKVRVWYDVREDAPPSRVLAPPHYDQITALATATREGRDPVVLTASKDRHLRAWSLPSRGAPLAAQVQAHHDVVTAVAYVPAAGHAVSAGRDGTLRFWCIEEPSRLRLEPSSDGYLARHSAAPVSALTARDDHFVSVSHDKTIKLWRPQAGDGLSSNGWAV